MNLSGSRVLITGGSGLIGKSLTKALNKQGTQVCCLIRQKRLSSPNTIFWNPATGEIEKEKLNNFDYVIHLAGENIKALRWTKQKKKRIYESRIIGTRLLVDSLLSLEHPPKVFFSASAVGIYGHQGERELTEELEGENSFLSSVCTEWEREARRVQQQKSIRHIQGRIGVVLTKQGGALPPMLLPFQLGFGGYIGNGKQYMSWITLCDLVAAILFCLQTNSLTGPVNLTAPSPVTNKEFTRILGAHLHRPTLLPIPAFVVKLLLGQMGKELLLSSARATPKKLLKNGFLFSHPDLKAALEAIDVSE